jgi:hypothetical protein
VKAAVQIVTYDRQFMAESGCSIGKLIDGTKLPVFTQVPMNIRNHRSLLQGKAGRTMLSLIA